MDTPQTSRRIYIFWPLVLVAGGVLWLLANFGVIAGENFFVLFRLWPVLLIAAGLDLLFGRRWPLVSALIAVVTVGLAVVAVVFAPQLGLAGPTWNWTLPGIAFGSERGSGTVITETREVSDFDKVVFSTFGDLTIEQGERESLTIEAEDNVLPGIVTEMRDGQLIIEYPEQFGRGVVPTRPVRYTLTVRNLSLLAISGAGNVTMPRLKTETLAVSLSGAGNFDLTDLQADRLDFTLSGAGNMNASGEVESQGVRLSGLGNYDAADLQSSTAEVSVSGAGSATVWVEQDLDVKISGAGSVNYYGDPEVRSDISGLGNVDRIGDK
jgi:hypothetical protein